MSLKVTVDEKKKVLIIELPYHEPRLSKSEKNYIIASTKGSLQTETKFHGKNITIGINAYIPKDD